MKYQMREKLYEVNLWELKSFVLKVASFYRLQYLETNILITCALDELRSVIKNHPMLHQMILKHLMKQINLKEDEREIEKDLVMMRQLLQWNDDGYSKYREAFIKRIKSMALPYFTSDLYILMRHLVKSNYTLWLSDLDLVDDAMQKYFMCEIYLIEEDYKMAYTYLKDCRYVGVLKEYDQQLKAYSYLKYKKYILKEPVFKINYLGDSVWMRSQLKY